jgi:1-acyl-sn-glycerol-3-phosphate acyltransferase
VTDAIPGARGSGWRLAVRSQLNRVLVAITLFVALPTIAIAEPIRRGAGRRVAVGTVRWLAWACGVRVEVRGGDDLLPGRSYVLVPNHRGHLDIALMFLARPGTRFVGAQELFRIPLLASAMRALGTVAVDRGNLRHARQQLASIATADEPVEMVVFAEGGIVLPGEDRQFKTGAFVLALDLGASIVPVAIRGSAEVAPPTSRLTVRPGLVVVDLLPAVSTEGLGRADRKRLRSEVEATVRAAIAR